MKLNTVITIAAIVGPLLAISSLFGWFRDKASWADEKAHSDSIIETLEVAVQKLEVENASIAATADSAIAVSEAEVEKHLEHETEWKEKASETRQVLNTVLESVEDSVAERISSVVDNLEAQHEQRVASLTLALAEKDSIIDWWFKKYEAEARLRRQLRVAFDSTKIEVAKWQNRAKPSFFDRKEIKIASFVIAVGSGYALGSL